MRTRVASAAALTVVLSLVLSGCGLFDTKDKESLPPPSLSPSPVPSSDTSKVPPTSKLAPYYSQKLTWTSCRGGDQCTRLKVPLDYAHPGGQAISIAVLKVPARSKTQRIGSLVVNPGGPGGSGVDYAANDLTYFGSELLQAFDIVGFDPRGVGESTPIRCLSDAKLDAVVASDPDPDTAAEMRHSDALLRQFGRGCLEHSGALARHVSTLEAAKDIDVLRAALGDSKLSYFGASYGTFLGATYAGLFPKRVGRMVLDGAIDPSLSALRMSLASAHGFEVALRAYVNGCVSKGGCFLGSSVDEGIAQIQKFLAEVEQNPLPGSAGRPLTAGNAVLGIWAPLYNKKYWPILDVALAAAFGGNGAPLLALSDAYTSRGPNGYLNNSLEALYAVNCLDRDNSIPTSKVPAYIPRFEKVSPTFGAIFAFGLSSCSTWPIHTHRQPAPIHANGAAPILVIGTTRDPATPMVWARALARQLRSGVLIKRDGDGHTGYHKGNACVDHTVESYLVSGKVPKHEVDC
jgi:pimeloyl-ACP methyl ester carboxylesterase